MYAICDALVRAYLKSRSAAHGTSPLRPVASTVAGSFYRSLFVAG